MSMIEIVSLLLLSVFVIAYISKLIILFKKDHINANVFGKGIKPKKTLLVEKALRIITFAGVAIWMADILFPKGIDKWFIRVYESNFVSWLGLVLTSIGVSFFVLAMLFMKTSWRVGIDKSTKTEIIKTGLYRYSRNPAFVGMNLMFIGTAITYANIVTIAIAILVILALHMQILQEENHMSESFGQQYRDYALKTPRYLLFK